MQYHIWGTKDAYYSHGINKLMNVSLYLHIPFCQHRCYYCDFNTTTGKSGLIPAYIKALSKEVRIVSESKTEFLIHTIYFGGGTPTLIAIDLYKELLTIIRTRFHVSNDCEISIEANPGTLSYDYLSGLRDLGFNRISMGVQSTNPVDLVRLDRIHSVADVLENLYAARKVGFRNINLDLIFSLPWQTLEDWQHSLKLALQLAPEHFSLYSLIIEPKTMLYCWYQKGLLAEQDQDLEGDMYESAMEMLQGEGYEQYEISNWAKKDIKKDYRCRHNLQYWLNRPYLGLGTGSHGYILGIRTENEPVLEEYIRRLKQDQLIPYDFPVSPATISTERINKDTQMKDFMLLGLRLVQEGVSKERFLNCYGEKMDKVFSKEIALLLKQGLVTWQKGDQARLCLTKRGIMVANQVFLHFV